MNQYREIKIKDWLLHWLPFLLFFFFFVLIFKLIMNISSAKRLYDNHPLIGFVIFYVLMSGGLFLIVLRLALQRSQKWAYQCQKCGQIFKKSFREELINSNYTTILGGRFRLLILSRHIKKKFLYELAIWTCPKCQKRAITKVLIEK